MTKLKQQKKCSKCDRNITERNKSGLCLHHYRLMWNNRRRKKLKEKLRCYDCGNEIKPKLIYTSRCNSCLEKLNMRRKKLSGEKG